MSDIDARLENLLEVVTRVVQVAEKNSNDIADLVTIIWKHDKEIVALRKDLAEAIDALNKSKDGD